jgi:hypothetical protein
MKHILTLFAVLALIAAVPGCDIGGGRGPTQDQLAEARTIEEEFAPLRREVQEFIRQHEGREDDIIGLVQSLEGTLISTEAEVQALRTAPREQFDEFKRAAEASIAALRGEYEMAREEA